MCSDRVIHVENLSKCYQIYKKPQDRLKQSLWRNRRKYYREFWALRDVSFDVYRGQTVGIVGRNGSGKSTLLQIICGTLAPTAGVVDVAGRVAALLELGAGFNPEFSGRENVYLHASIMGFSRSEINQRFADIIAFADIGEFIDQPVKMYSSGMYVRLAFATAINVDPEILIVDEALAVGDELFQRKCIARIEEIRRSGATILFVSHSPTMILELCDHALLIDGGQRLLAGSPRSVISSYQKLIYADSAKAEEIRNQIRALDQSVNVDSDSPNESGTGSNSRAAWNSESSTERFDPALKPQSTVKYLARGAEIRNPRILNDHGAPVNILVPGKSYTYAYDVHISAPADNVHFGMLIKSSTGVELSAMASHEHDCSIKSVRPGQVFSVEFRFKNMFMPGTFFMNAGCSGEVDGEQIFLHRIIDAAAFRVEQAMSRRRMTGYVHIADEPACNISNTSTSN